MKRSRGSHHFCRGAELATSWDPHRAIENVLPMTRRSRDEIDCAEREIKEAVVKGTKQNLSGRESARAETVARATDDLIHDLPSAHHKRVLAYLNSASSPFDLMTTPTRPMSEG